jgi:hypothetical protein
MYLFSHDKLKDSVIINHATLERLLSRLNTKDNWNVIKLGKREASMYLKAKLFRKFTLDV